MFLPTTPEEMKTLQWGALDVVLVTGDAYIDSPFVGVAVIGKVLLDTGLRVGIIAQPDTASEQDIRRLGEPSLFWGVTAGCIDSMVANYTATGRRRRSDDYTPGGINTRRPDRAVIVYSNLIRRYFKHTRPIVLGGIEASLRRIAHYDFWSHRIRRSILFDAKADYLLYGMADHSACELAACLRNGKDPRSIRGLCYPSPTQSEGALALPSFEEVAHDKVAFRDMFHLFYRNNDPITGRPLAQKQDSRYLIQTPPPLPLSQQALDAVHALRYERALHPYHRKDGTVKALDTIGASIATHRGCYGECHFCAIAVHQGRTVTWRSRDSIVAEAKELAVIPGFKGIIRDVGGPTANMYGIECSRKEKEGACPSRRCLFPTICPGLPVDHGAQIRLLKELRSIDGVKKVFVASGIRHDMILADTDHGVAYLEELIRHHVSGQMKIAPEHSETRVLEMMGKPGPGALLRFKALFTRLTQKHKKTAFLTYYLIAAHPGCTDGDMRRLRSFALRELHLLPEQVQIFTPTPSTYSTLMYWTGENPFDGKPCFVETTLRGREHQKRIMAKA